DLHGFASCSFEPDQGRATKTDRVYLYRRLLVAVDDASAGQVVRREFDDDPVLGQDADVVLPHLAADVGQNLVAIGELHPEHGVREWLDHPAFDLDGPVFLRHVLRYLTSGMVAGTPSRFTSAGSLRLPHSRCSGQADRGRKGMPESTRCAEQPVYAACAANTKPTAGTAVGCVGAARCRALDP